MKRTILTAKEAAAQTADVNRASAERHKKILEETKVREERFQVELRERYPQEFVDGVVAKQIKEAIAAGIELCRDVSVFSQRRG